MNIKNFLSLKFGLVTFLGLMIVTVSNAHAEISKEAAAQQMLSTGKWTVALTDDYGNSYHVDPYSIAKISDNVFQINAASPNFGGNMNISQIVQTFEFDCAARRYAHVGWRYPGGFRAREIIGGKAWNKLDQNIGNSQSGPKFTIPNFYSRHVCMTKMAEGMVIDVFGVVQNKNLYKFYFLKNTIYRNSKENVVFSYLFGNGRSDSKFYANCKTSEVTSQDGAAISTGPGNPILVDWMCKKLHPDTVVIEQDFDIPKREPEPTDTGNSPDALSAIEAAKRQCSELGFKLGTEKFGNCVLKVSR